MSLASEHHFSCFYVCLPYQLSQLQRSGGTRIVARVNGEKMNDSAQFPS